MDKEKSNIIETRSTGLGSSDAKMVYKIGLTGEISDTAKQRLAIMLGLEEPKTFSTTATDTGHLIENELFEVVKGKYEDAVSNPYREITGGMFDKLGFKVFNHIDFEIIRNSVIWFECKAVKDDIEVTIDKYKEQLQWHYMILELYANKQGKKEVLNLIHYKVDDYERHEFTEENLSVRKIPKQSTVINTIKKGLHIISKEIKDFKYEAKEELSAYALPEKYQESLDEITTALKTIEHHNEKVNIFKEKMLALMLSNNVKSIKNDYFNIIVVPEGNSVRFDSKRFEKDKPLIHKKYLKTIKKKAHVRIKIK